MTEPAGPIQQESFSANPDEALEMMMKLYGNIVLRSAFFYTGDRHLAEDISQETFIRAYRGWSKFRGGSSVKTWLIKIAINVSKDRLGLKMSDEQPTDPSMLESGRTMSVEEEALGKLAKSEVLQYVLKLPQAHQEVLYLYYYLDMGTREIAELLQSPDGTVRARLHRAREQLGELMAKDMKREEFTS